MKTRSRVLPACKAAAAVGCLACSAAGAQTVTLYGIVDVGIEHVRNALPSGASMTRMPSLTSSVPSRWGLRGREDLGGGLQAEFVLESGFAPDVGSLGQGGRIFGRQAWVGLQGRWGQASVGRQYTMLGASLADADVFGPNIYGHASLDPYLPNARADNAVVYRARFSGVTVGAHYSLGRDAVNAGPSLSGTNCPGELASDRKACRSWSALLKYDAGTSWGAALAIDRIHGGTGAFGGLTSSSMTDTRSVASGYVTMAGAKLGAYVLHRDNDAGGATPRSNLYYIGASYPYASWTLDAAVFRHDQKHSANDADLLALRVTHHFSKRTAAYLQAARMSNDGASAKAVGVGGTAPAAGATQTGINSGLRHVF